MKVRARFIIRTENGLVRPGETFETDTANALRLGKAVEIIADPTQVAEPKAEEKEEAQAEEPEAEKKEEAPAEEKPKRGRRKAE